MKSLKELHNEFVDEQRYQVGRSLETIRGYKQSFQLLVSLLPELTLKTLKRESLTLFFKRLDSRTRIVGKGIKKKGIKKSTVATYRSKLSSFFEWLKDNGKIDENPFKGVKHPAPKYTDTRYLKQEEIEKIFTSISMHQWPSLFVKKRNLALFGVALYCGLRRSEILGIHVIDVDLKYMLLTVRADTSKSKEQREIPINRYLAQLLDDYLQERKMKKLKSLHLFTSSTQDSGFTRDGLKHLVERVKKISDVNFYMHRFRHTFAVNVIANRGGIYQLQKLMGHKDINMTTKYLRGFPIKKLRKEVDALNLRSLV